MARKDYTLIAKVLLHVEDLKTRKQLAKMFALALSIENPRFHQGRFLAACQLESKE